jgi:hypothetical protein
MLEGNNPAIQRFLDKFHEKAIALVMRYNTPNYSEDYINRQILKRVMQLIVDTAKESQD